MITLFRNKNKVRYNKPKTVKLLPSGEVFRKYFRNGKEVIWKQVDYVTLSPRDKPRLCPNGYKKRLLQTAY